MDDVPLRQLRALIVRELKASIAGEMDIRELWLRCR